MDDYAFGELDAVGLAGLYDMHVAVMFFCANEWNARAYGSAALAAIAVALVDRAGGADTGSLPSDAKVVGLYAHDTNQLYLRQLLDVGWTSRASPRLLGARPRSS